MHINHRRSGLLPLLLVLGALTAPAGARLNRQPFVPLVSTATSMTEKAPGLEDARMTMVHAAEALGSDGYAPRWSIVAGAGATMVPAEGPKSWTRHLIWIVPLALLLMILLLLMRRTDEE